MGTATVNNSDRGAAITHEIIERAKSLFKGGQRDFQRCLAMAAHEMAPRDLRCAIGERGTGWYVRMTDG